MTQLVHAGPTEAIISIFSHTWPPPAKPSNQVSLVINRAGSSSSVRRCAFYSQQRPNSGYRGCYTQEGK